MTLDQDIADATATFTEPDEFGEKWYLYVEGKTTNLDPIPFNGVFDEDSLPGTNETMGDGRTLNNSVERNERRSAILECPNSIRKYVQNEQDDHRPDVFKRVSDGTFWAAKRIIGSDASMFAILLIQNVTIRRHQRRIVG